MSRAQPFIVALFAALAVAISPAPVMSQPRQIPGQGTEGFRALIASYQMKPLRNLRDLNDVPERTLLIAFRGAETARRSDPLDDLPVNGGVRGFISRGGAVLYASDQAKRFGWVEDFDVSVDGNKIFGLPTSCYQDREFCPFVVRRVGINPELFHGRDRPGVNSNRTTLHRVATNRPSFLHPSDKLVTLATISFPARYERARQYSANIFHFAQGKRYDGGGQILVLADHSVFINDMLLPDQADLLPEKAATDNLAFAANCLDWLTIGPNLQKRDRVLFIDQTGVIETNFDLALAATDLPPPPVNPSQIPGFLWENRDLLWEHRDKLADLEDAGFFRDIEETNFWNHLLLAWQPHWVWVRLALVLMTFILLGLGIRRFLGSRFRHAKNASRLAVALDRYRPRVGLLEQRLRSAMSRGQALEAAREKARQFFADFELTPADFGQTLPECVIDAGWWQRRTLARDLREAWRIAFGSESIPVPVRQWPAYLARLQNLRQAIRKGIIRFA